MKTKTLINIVCSSPCPLDQRRRLPRWAAGLALGTSCLASAVPAFAQPLATPPGYTVSISSNAPVADLSKYLAWDADVKKHEAKAGEAKAQFTFYVTNISSETVVITNLVRTCGCTEATLPSQPWTLAPGDSGPIKATIDLAGKAGRISKQLTVQSPAGSKALTLEVTIAPPTSGAVESSMDRLRNQQLAAQDRQAVFKGDCAKCHVEPTIAKTGKELYQAGCAICHEAEHRAAMVPDLHRLNHPTDAEYWSQWISSSKLGSLMPAFGQASGGPLSEAQIQSLVEYLTQTITRGS